MHIPDGFLDPKISYGLMGMAAAVLSYCFQRVKAAITALAPQEALSVAGAGIKNLAGRSRRVLTKFGEQKLYLMGMVAALVFAAQMFNFPIDKGTSGHLIGGVLAAVLLGPFAGTIVVAAVLLIQMLFYADGGVIAIGANIINMGLIGTIVAYYIYAALKTRMNKWLSIGIAAWCSVVLAALVCSLELGISGTASIQEVIGAMLRVHFFIGIAEAFITIVLIQLFHKIVPVKGEEE